MCNSSSIHLPLVCSTSQILLNAICVGVASNYFLQLNLLYLAGSERVTLLIKYKEEYLQLSLNLSSKVLELKSRLVQYWRWLKDSSYTLEFNDEVLENHEEIRKYGIDEKSIIILKIFPLDSSQAPPSGSQGTRSLYDTLYRQSKYRP